LSQKRKATREISSNKTGGNLLNLPPNSAAGSNSFQTSVAGASNLTSASRISEE